jgi:hypothetical protein
MGTAAGLLQSSVRPLGERVGDGFYSIMRIILKSIRKKGF